MEAEALAQHHARNVKLPFRHVFGYSTGQLVEGVVVHSCNVFLFFYLTAVCGLTSSLAGIALAMGLIVDAVLDPLIGSSSDNFRSRFGRRLPFMAFGLGPLAVALVMIFSLPTGLEDWSLFLWICLLSVTMRVSLSVFILPYMALGAELTENYEERSVLNAWRWGIGILGALVAIALGFGVFFEGENGLENREAYTSFGFTLATVIVVGGLLAIFTAYTTRGRQHQIAESSSIFSVFGEVREVFNNASFRVIFGSALFFFIAIGVHTTLGLHGNKYFWNLTNEQIQWVTLSMFGGLVLGAPVAGPFLKFFEKRTVALVGMAGLLTAYGLPPSLRLLGLLPLTGNELAIVLAAATLTGGITISAAAIAFGSMMADAADEHEYLFGSRREGLFFAGWMFAMKAAMGAGALISGFALDLIGFSAPEPGSGELIEQTASVVQQLGVIYGPGCALVGFIGLAATFWYRLDRQRHAEVLVDLRARRG